MRKMEYSVGSLADLISGSNTPNKIKIIQKEFKKESQDLLDTDNKIRKKLKPFKKSAKKVTQEPDGKKARKQKLKKLKNANVKENKEDITDSNKKPKLKHTKFSFSKQDNVEVENIKQKKVKKRKLDMPNDNSGSINADEHPPLKKKKLSENKQNAEKRINNKNKKPERVENPEELARTVYVGNIPINTDKGKIERHFKSYGKIESIRIRGIPVADPKVSKKVAAIKKEFNPNRTNVFCFIKFENKEDALKVEAENGVLFEQHHLRVHSCASKEKPDETKAIFVGNLNFDAEEDELWKLFESCGTISFVRIVRDSKTGMGKGFGYVNFKDSDAVQLALEMENVKLRERELRISLCNLNVARKKKYSKNKKVGQSGKQKQKKIEYNVNEEISADNQGKVKQAGTGFEGTKFTDKKKKRKVNKGLLEKKKMMKKIAPKPKVG